ncbi:MAG: YceI family protein, partial [Verrucomicrobia bacterium]|nr:YceI family protein [Verrucomicrobiota bacterium]
MKLHHLTSLLAAAAACLLAGCSDPADSVHKTSASDPKKTGSGSAAAGKEYVIRAESTIGFVGSKVTGSHNGGFKNFAGKLNVAGGKLVGTPEIKIATGSLWADNDRLTGHLKSPDFFDVATFPVASFTATSIAPAGAQHNVTGNLDLH